MSNIGKEIVDFLTPSGKSSSEITHGLKSIGDGESMETGFLTILDFFKIKQKSKVIRLGKVVRNLV